jgi:DNA-directed RNA polymerase specialized sigma24 family protein
MLRLGAACEDDVILQVVLDRLQVGLAFLLDALDRGARLLLRLLADLDENKREVFLLTELEGFTAPEIAEALEIPVNTVYSRLRTARETFQSAMARYEQLKGSA